MKRTVVKLLQIGRRTIGRVTQQIPCCLLAAEVIGWSATGNVTVIVIGNATSTSPVTVAETNQ
jgi:hypothetical protein